MRPFKVRWKRFSLGMPGLAFVYLWVKLLEMLLHKLRL